MTASLKSYSLPVLCLALGLASPADAQNNFTSPTGLRAYTWSNASGTKIVTTPARGRLIPSATAKAKSGLGTASTSATYKVGTSGSVTTTLTLTGSGNYTSATSRATGVSGNQDTLLTLNPGKSVMGTLHLSWKIATRDAADAFVSVDIGNDRKIDWRAHRTNATQSFRIVVPVRGGLKILTNSIGTASASSTLRNPSFSASLTMTWVPDPAPCSFTAYGKSCGPRLTGSNLPTGSLTLHLGSVTPKSPTLLLLGLKSTQIQLPGTACYLATLPLLAVPSMATASGSSDFSFPRPRSAIVGLMTQGVALDAKSSKILLSNGIRVDCP